MTGRQVASGQWLVVRHSWSLTFIPSRFANQPLGGEPQDDGRQFTNPLFVPGRFFIHLVSKM